LALQSQLGKLKSPAADIVYTEVNRIPAKIKQKPRKILLYKQAKWENVKTDLKNTHPSFFLTVLYGIFLLILSSNADVKWFQISFADASSSYSLLVVACVFLRSVFTFFHFACLYSYWMTTDLFN
jgi:hypothetical protein